MPSSKINKNGIIMLLDYHRYFTRFKDKDSNNNVIGLSAFKYQKGAGHSGEE